MASVILAGTPAEVVGAGGGGGIQTIVSGEGIGVDNTNPNAPVLNLVVAPASQGITTSFSGVAQTLVIDAAVASVAGGTGVAAATSGTGDVTLGLNFAPASAEFLMLQLNQDGTVASPAANFVPAYTGWYVFQPSITMGTAAFNFPAGASIQFWIQQGATPDPNSFVCFTSAAPAPPAGLGALEDTRNAVVHLTAGLPYTPYFEWNGAGLNLGTPTSTVGGAAVYMVPLFA